MKRLLMEPVSLHDWSYFVLTRGLSLTAFTISVAIMFRLWPDAGNNWRLGWYADYLLSMSTISLGASLLGALLLEDVIRKCT